jgi:hypothetical protein
MTKQSDLTNRRERKLMLADKYERRSKSVNSKPASVKLMRQSLKYRRQADLLKG